MASRVNTKFVMILSGTVLVGALIVAGLVFMQMRTDADRNVRLGDELLAQGELREAASMYSRAVHKRPGNLEYIQKLEEATLAIVPRNSDEAGERYRLRLGLLEHRALHFPHDPEMHLALIDELLRNARYTNQTFYWRYIASAAQKMWDRVPLSDPTRIHAKLYRGSAELRLAALSTKEEALEAEQDLVTFLDAVPESDFGWAELIRARLSQYQRLRADRQTRRAEEKLEELRQDFRRGLAEAPDGPEMAMVTVRFYGYQRAAEIGDITEEQLDDAIAVMLERIRATNDPVLILNAAELLMTIGRQQDLEAGATLVRGYLETHPEQVAHRMFLAQITYRAGLLEEAEQEARSLVETRPLKVSFMSQLQYELRNRAAGLIVDIAAQRWDQAPADQRTALLDGLVGARAELAKLVPDPVHPLSLRADGKVAYAKGDIETAAAKFDQLATSGAMPDPETYYFSAICLDRIGQTGAAHDRIERALAYRPNNHVLLLEKAKLEYRMLRHEEALETTERILRLVPDYEPARELTNLIRLAVSSDQFDESTMDPVTRGLTEAGKKATSGDLDGAHAELLAALQHDPEDVRVLEALLRLEFNRGNREAASEYLQRALAITPDDVRLQRFQMVLEIEDPLELVQRVVDLENPGPTDRAILLAVQYRGLADRKDAEARQAEAEGDPTAAKAARAVAETARTRADQHLAEAKAQAPDDPRLVDHLFVRALADQNWTEAEALARKAADLDIDRAGGMLYLGQLELNRGNLQEAIRALSQATERKKFSSAAWRLLGIAYRRIGNFAQARIAFEQAYNNNPNDMTNVRDYVNLLVQTGETTRALIITRNARKLDPTDRTLRDVWLQLEAQTGEGALALKTRREIFKRSPEDTTNAARLVGFLTRTAPTRELLLDEAGELRYSTRQWDRLSAADRQRMLAEEKQKWYAECDRVLAQLVERSGMNLNIAALKASVLRERGKPLEGEQVLRGFIESRPAEERNAPMYIALATFQTEIDRGSAAAETMKEGREYQDPEQREVDRALAQLLFQRLQYQAALPIFQSLVRSAPSRELRLMELECLVQVGQYPEASQRLREFIADEGEDYVTAMYQASIAEGAAEQLMAEGKTLEAQRKYEEQFAALAQAERLNPADPMPHIHRARRWLKEFARSQNPALLEDALGALARADEIRAGFLQTSLMRVQVLQAKQDDRGAINELRRLIERSPGDRQIRQELIKLLLRTNNVENALQIARDAIELQPTIALWHEIAGDILYDFAGRRQEALPYYLESLKLQPTRTALVKMSTALVTVSPPQYSQLADLLARFPEEVEADPILGTHLAVALAGAGQREAGVQRLKIAYHKWKELIENGGTRPSSMFIWFQSARLLFPLNDPAAAEAFLMDLCRDNPGPYELAWLASTWANAPARELDRAIDLMRQAIYTAPEDDTALRADFHADLGNYLFISGDTQGALDAFGRVIELDPRNARVLNNYAYLLGVDFKDPNKALPHARRALELLPGDPSIEDTVGWLMYLTGDLEGAEDHLRQSVRIRPDASNNLHLARVLFDKGKVDQAETYLRQASEMKPDEQTMAEINRLADDIRTRGQ